MGISIMIGNRIATGKKSGAGYSGPAPLVHYDFSRYSNEDFLDNPDMLVKDITGNGYDLKLYNFAFAGMSGFGGYAENFNDHSSPSAALISDHKLIHTVVSGNAWIWTRSSSAYSTTKSMQAKITGLSNSGISIYYYYIPSEKPDTRDFIDITSDGTYTLPASALYLGDGTQNIGFWQSALSDLNIGTTITIEQLPTYPGGLVSDGVDDYGECVKQFVLTDFTVVAVRNYADFTQADNSTLVSKVAGYDSNGAFLFEDGTKKILSYSFGTGIRCSERPSLFSYITKTSNNGTNMTPGTVVDKPTNMLRIFTRCLTCPKTSAVLYELRIYDYSLTKEELQLVKDDMMRNYEKYAKPLEGITYVADWDAKGRSNDEDADVRDK